MSRTPSPKPSSTVTILQDTNSTQETPHEKLLPPAPKRRFCSTAWLWEVLSLLVSASCITAVLILLLIYNNKPIPTWDFITLNTAISVLAVVAKSALLVPVAEAISQMKWFWFWNDRKARPVIEFQEFDSASRGPWGSCLLLLKPRTWCLVTVGAFITLAALGMEPSLQQIQTYSTRTVETGTASIRRVANYSDLDTDASFQAMPLLGVAAKGAVYSGLFSSGSSPTGEMNDATCSTGNCTWPTYSSLEVCSACRNLTDLVKNNLTDGSHGYTWRLPNGASVDSSMDVMQADSGKESTAFKAMKMSPLLDMTALFFPPGAYVTDISPQAWECILYFCVKTYNTSMENGSLSHKTTQVWPDVSNPPSAKNLSTDGTAYLDPLLSTFFDKTNHLTNWTLHPGASQADKMQTYPVDFETFGLLRSWLSSLIMGQVSADPSMASSVGDIQQSLYSSMTQIMRHNARENAQGADSMPGPAALFERMGASMTAYLRARSKDVVVGSAVSSETYVRVRWAWAVLPLTLLVLSSVLLAATAVVSSRRGMPVWKSSALPGLIHGLDEGTCTVLGGYKPEGLGRMERRAQNYWVVVSDERGTMRLRSRRKRDAIMIES